MELQKENLGKVAVTVEEDYHDINKDYDKLTIVEEKGAFKTYISRIPVPKGTQLTNRKYWIPYSGIKESILIDYNKFKNEVLNSVVFHDDVDGEIENPKREQIGENIFLDTEDLQLTDNAIQFADRDISKGMGYKILRPRFIEENRPKVIITCISKAYYSGMLHIAFNGINYHVELNENDNNIIVAKKIYDVLYSKLNNDYNFILDNNIITIIKWDSKLINDCTINNGDTKADVRVENTIEHIKANILVQDDFNQENTIYEIRYNFDLDNKKIIIPNNCIFNFKGGKLINGILIGNNTNIKASTVNIFDNIIIQGYWNIPIIYSEWFALSETPGYDNTPILESLFNLTSDILHNTIIFPCKTYYISSHVKYGITGIDEKLYLIKIKSNTTVILNAHLILNGQDKAHYHIFDICDCENVTIKGCGQITGDLETHIGSEGEFGHAIHIGNAKNIIIQGLTLDKCWGDGIDADSNYKYDYRDVENGKIPGETDPTKYHANSHNDISHQTVGLVIDNVRFEYNRRQGVSLEGASNVEIKNCTFYKTGQINGHSPMFGIDVEPWRKNDANHNINIHNNTFIDNKGGCVALYCVGGDNSGYGYDIQIKDNITSGRIAVSGVTGLYIDNENISTLSIWMGSNIKVNNCKVTGLTRIEPKGGTAEQNHNITFNKCVFDPEQEYSSDFKGIFYFADSTKGWKTSFVDCVFNIKSNIAITTPSLNSEEEYDRCVFNAEGYAINIGAFKNIQGCKFKCDHIKLTCCQNARDYTFSKNTIHSSTGSSPIILIGNSNIGEITKDIYIQDNFVWGDSTKHFLGKQNLIFDQANVYIEGNKSTGRPRWKEVKSMFTKSVLYRNEAVNPVNIDASPLKGDYRFQENINKWVVSDGNDKWLDFHGFQAGFNNGSGDKIPTGLTLDDSGYPFFRLDIDKMTFWFNNKWVEADGAKAGVRRTGTLAQRPAKEDIYDGFAYRATDYHIAENPSGTLGCMLYFVYGSNDWIDCFGRRVE